MLRKKQQQHHRHARMREGQGTHPFHECHGVLLPVDHRLAGHVTLGRLPYWGDLPYLRAVDVSEACARACRAAPSRAAHSSTMSAKDVEVEDVEKSEDDEMPDLEDAEDAAEAVDVRRQRLALADAAPTHSRARRLRARSRTARRRSRARR
jgi:hypothetical protein